MTDLVWLLDFLQRVRLQSKDHGAHLLFRFHWGHRETDVVPVSEARRCEPLLGLSHVVSRFVIYVEHLSDAPHQCFRAIALRQNGTSEAFSAGPSGPIAPDADNSSWQDSKLGLYLQRIAWGKPTLLNQYSPRNWVLATSLRRVVELVERGELTEESGSVLKANAVLQRGIAESIAVLRRAENPSRAFRVEGADDWYTITCFGPFLGSVAWDDLDAETLGSELGFSPDTARWLTARGIGSLTQVELPGVEDLLGELEKVAPRIASNMWSWIEVVKNSFIPHYLSPVERWRRRWKADDPLALLQIVRDSQSARGGAEGTIVIGYRRSETGRLSVLAQREVGLVTDTDGRRLGAPTTGMLGPELIAVPDLVGADGVLLIDSDSDGWNAVAVNRDGEQGQACSHWAEDASQFVEEVIAPEAPAALSRILTGRARFDTMCTPFELARRGILYGLARALERPNIGANAEIARPLIDLVLLGQLNKHVVPILPSKGESVIGSPLEGIAWEAIGFALRGVRDHISWEDVRLEALAEAWAIPSDEARWWRQDGLAGREGQFIPDETESLIRCAQAVGEYAEAAEIFDHLRTRAQQIFGEDLPVLWSLVPEPWEVSDRGGTLSP